MKTNMPKLRFPEFRKAPEWEEKRLEAFADLYKGKGISKADISPDGQIQCIRYGELYTSYGEIIETVLSATNLPASELFFSKRNDVILPSSGETKEDISTASCVMLDDIALGGDLNVIRCDQCGKFISYYLNGQKKKEIAKIAQGDTVVHLYVKQLKQLEIALPKPLEQQKIADCLSSLDELIFTESRKLDALASYKKGLMQQLFPAEGETVPKLRFPEFRNAPAWKKEPLGKSYKLRGGYAFKSENFDVSGIPVIRISNIPIETDVIDISQCVYHAQINNAQNFTVKYRDLLIAMSGATTGKTAVYQERQEAYVNQRVGLFKAKSNEHYYPFLCQWVKSDSFSKQLDKLLAPGAQPNISPSEIESIEFSVPKLYCEQQKIADCLASLDELIAVQTEKLDGLKNFKKGMLQQLFPAVDEVSV